MHKLLMLAAVLLCVYITGCAAGSESESEPAPATSAAAASEPESDPAPSTSTTVTPESRQSPAPISANGATAEVADMRAPMWQAFTGLEGPDDAHAWQDRVQRACHAPIWEQGPAETLAAELLREDGGDPDQPGPLPSSAGLLTDAVWALWMLAHAPQGCPDAFPPLASTVAVWHNTTGLRGPTALAEWRARLDRVCATPSDGPDVEQLATEFVNEDGAAAEPSTVKNAVVALQVIARHPEACP